MRNSVTLPMVLIVLFFCGCTQNSQEPTQTRFLFDTVVQITADCDEETLSGAFSLCEELERKLSRTVEGSDVARLNEAGGFVTVSDDTAKVLERSLFYAGLSGGKFDITICPVSMLWDFKNQIVPSRAEIAAALRNVDYHSIVCQGNRVSLNGKKIDLGGIAKGYAADCLCEYFKKAGVKRALLNLGGNIAMLGEYTVGIKTPFEETVAVAVDLKDQCAVTSGIDQRYIEQNGVIYHHILDPDTGYGVQNELASVTVLGKCSTDCDALSTVCMLLGTEKGVDLINQTSDTEAVFIGRDATITLTAGLYRENEKIYFK